MGWWQSRYRSRCERSGAERSGSVNAGRCQHLFERPLTSRALPFSRQEQICQEFESDVVHVRSILWNLGDGAEKSDGTMEPIMEPEPMVPPVSAGDTNKTNPRRNRVRRFLVALIVLVLFLATAGVVARFMFDESTVRAAMEDARQSAVHADSTSGLGALAQLDRDALWMTEALETGLAELESELERNVRSDESLTVARLTAPDAPEEAVLILDTIPETYPAYSQVAVLRAETEARLEMEREIRIIEHVQGSSTAPVTLLVYNDFQCPACAAFVPVVKEVLEEFPAEVRFQYKHFPLPIHPNAELAARAAEAAGQQGRFFEYHDRLFDQQRRWVQSADPRPLFIEYAEEMELGAERFTAHLDSVTLKRKVEDERRDALALDLVGVPTFFLNGQRMDISTYEEFAADIAAEVERQRSLPQEEVANIEGEYPFSISRTTVEDSVLRIDDGNPRTDESHFRVSWVYEAEREPVNPYISFSVESETGEQVAVGLRGAGSRGVHRQESAVLRLPPLCETIPVEGCIESARFDASVRHRLVVSGWDCQSPTINPLACAEADRVRIATTFSNWFRVTAPAITPTSTPATADPSPASTI